MDMEDHEIQIALGRIEQKIDDVRIRLLGEDGMEARLRMNETDIAVMKAKAGMIAAFVSLLVSVISAAAHWLIQKP
jgi:hypothetical protein